MKRIFPLFIVLVTLLSCSPGSDMLETGDPHLDPSDQPSLDYTFKGVWMVDNVKGNETYIRTVLGFKGENYVACADYPYAAIMEKFLPDVKVAKLSAETPYINTPTPE